MLKQDQDASYDFIENDEDPSSSDAYDSVRYVFFTEFK